MTTTASASEGEKILIVDDDARLRRLLERFLDEQGYRVRTVENTEQMDRLLSREIFCDSRGENGRREERDQEQTNTTTGHE